MDVRQCSATTRNQTESLKRNSAMERRAQVQSYVNQTELTSELNLYNLLCSCWMTLLFEEQLKWRKLLTWTDCLSRFRWTQSQMRSCINVTSGLGAWLTFPFMTQYTKKTGFTREQPMHPPKVSKNPKFIQNLLIMLHYAWTWNANCFLWIGNVMYKDFQLPRHSCRNIYQT